MLKLKDWRGINNVSEPECMKNQELAVALDVDVGLDREIRRRGGFTQLSEACHKNVHEGQGYALATRLGGELVAWPDGAPPEAATSLHPSLGIARVWYCNLPDGRTAFTNGLINGITDGQRASDWGVPVPQELGGSTQVAGKLPQGEYRYALTYTRLADGLEGGAVYSTPLVLDEGGLLLMGLPVLEGYQINVYLTPPNSDHAYHAGVARGDSWSYMGEVDALTLPCRTAFLQPAPVGTVLAFWRGRVLVAVGNVLYASLHAEWELFDLQRDYKQFGAAITLIQPVDDGIYVGTERGLVFLAGTEFDSLQYVPLLPEPVVLGSGVAVRGDLVALGDGRGDGAAMLCIVGGGVLAGFNSGAVNRLTHQRYRTAAREVAATFREVGGMPQYIAIPQ